MCIAGLQMGANSARPILRGLLHIAYDLNNANVEKYRMSIPISRYFKIPILNTEKTFKISEKIPKNRYGLQIPTPTHYYALSPWAISVNVLIQLFARCYRWGAASEYRLEIGDSTPTGCAWPKFQVEGVAPTNHSFFMKTRLNDLPCNIKSGQIFPFLSQCTRLTDRQTDRQLSCS